MKESDVGGTVPTELGINPVSVTVMAATRTTRTTAVGVEDDNDNDGGEDVRSRCGEWVKNEQVQQPV